MALKMCKNCMLKFMKAIDLFFMKEKIPYISIESELRSCTQKKSRKGTECYEEFMDHLEHFIAPVFRKSGKTSSSYKKMVDKKSPYDYVVKE